MSQYNGVGSDNHSSIIVTPLNWKYALSSILLIPIFTYMTTSLKSAYALRSNKSEQSPPIVPYWIPFLGNVVAFARDAPGFAAQITRRFGFSIPVRVRFGPFKAYFISNADHFDVILKGARNLNSTPGLNLVLQTFFGLPKHVVPFYEADNSGIAAAPIPGSSVPPHHRINHLRFSAAQKYLHGPHLNGMTKLFVEHFGDQIAKNDEINRDWVELPNLTDFLQKNIFRAATSALCGPYLLSLNPTFIDDFWEYIGDIPVLYKGLPRWWNPKAHRARDRCLAAIQKWHLHAWDHVDRSKDDDSVPWEPYFGARIMRTRYTYARGMEATSEKSRAAEDLAMIFAANANAVPATIYFIVEFLRDPHLLLRAHSEVSAARLTSTRDSQPPLFDLPRLCESPLLQSVYAETLRLRVAVILMRSPEKHDFKLGRWLFRTGDLIFLCSQTAARNRDLWNEGTAQDPHPLDEFWAERFLVYPDDPASGPLKNKEKEEPIHNDDDDNGDDAKTIPNPPGDDKVLEKPLPRATAIATKVASKEKGSPRFSTQGLAGGWVPFGGGARMCPGRFFAKNEMMASLAMLITSYDVELRTPQGWKLEADMSYFLVGALPPKGKIPVRIRRRVGG